MNGKALRKAMFQFIRFSLIFCQRNRERVKKGCRIKVTFSCNSDIQRYEVNAAMVAAYACLVYFDHCLVF